ncbi:helix-turn-helix domain-containing protein [Paenibacillus sp. 1P03SA]|uniref:helix-turn-helix domain-containing protein n=1 Tax=Paenibacillus sp. 1P03SA TaxID=3132294 RepID=UPI0039A0F3FA
MVATEQNHNLKSNLKEILNKYYVHKQASMDVDGKPFEFISKDEYDKLSLYAKDDYSPMTQTQLAQLTGLRPNSVSELVKLRQININLGHITKVAQCLGIKSISEIIEFNE